MAVRTYIPGILAIAKYLTGYLANNAEKLKSYMGDGLYSVLVLVVDLLTIIAQIISAGQPAPDEPWTDFVSVGTLSSTEINQITAAWNKFLTANGITVG